MSFTHMVDLYENPCVCSSPPASVPPVCFPFLQKGKLVLCDLDDQLLNAKISQSSMIIQKSLWDPSDPCLGAKGLQKLGVAQL